MGRNIMFFDRPNYVVPEHRSADEIEYQHQHLIDFARRELTENNEYADLPLANKDDTSVANAEGYFFYKYPEALPASDAPYDKASHFIEQIITTNKTAADAAQQHIHYEKAIAKQHPELMAHLDSHDMREFWENREMLMTSYYQHAKILHDFAMQRSPQRQHVPDNFLESVDLVGKVSLPPTRHR